MLKRSWKGFSEQIQLVVSHFFPRSLAYMMLWQLNIESKIGRKRQCNQASCSFFIEFLSILLDLSLGQHLERRSLLHLLHTS